MLNRSSGGKLPHNKASPNKRIVMFNYLDDTCVKTGDGCLYHFDMLSGDTYEIQQLKNNARVIDYVDTYFEFFECNENGPAIDPFD